MSKYTTELKTICENYAMCERFTGASNVENIIEKSRGKIFDFYYPIFDSDYKRVLESKILKHYYTREIGLETVGLWKLKLNTKLNEIMPYYNQLYKSELLEFNPFFDVDLTRTHNTVNNGSSSGNSKIANSTSNNSSEQHSVTNLNKFSDTPQGSLERVKSGDYLTNVTENIDNGQSYNNTYINNNVVNSESNTVKNVEDYLEKVKGKQGGADYSSLLLKYRETFLNIDVMIIEELSSLFMNLW